MSDQTVLSKDADLGGFFLFNNMFYTPMLAYFWSLKNFYLSLFVISIYGYIYCGSVDEMFLFALLGRLK